MATETTVTRPTEISIPELNPGVTLLTVDSAVERAIHALAVDHVLLSGGDACWIDPGTHAQTDPLVDLAPSSRILERFRVARGFTPFQHLELLRSLPGMCSDRTALIVAPRLDSYYRDDGLLADEGREMFLSGIAALAQAARRHDCPVLVTRARADPFSEPIATAATHTLSCEPTPFGPRFCADGDETLVYPTEDHRWVQTTLAFWAEILAAREPLYDPAASREGSDVQPEVTAHGTN